jgi:hypothetical protein
VRLYCPAKPLQCAARRKYVPDKVLGEYSQHLSVAMKCITIPIMRAVLVLSPTLMVLLLPCLAKVAELRYPILSLILLPLQPTIVSRRPTRIRHTLSSGRKKSSLLIPLPLQATDASTGSASQLLPTAPREVPRNQYLNRMINLVLVQELSRESSWEWSARYSWSVHSSSGVAANKSITMRQFQRLVRQESMMRYRSLLQRVVRALGLHR